MRENLKNPRWWAALPLALLVVVIGVPFEWLGKLSDHVVRNALVLLEDLGAWVHKED